MAEDTDVMTPPYVGFSTFINFIRGLRDTGVPQRIDSSLMKNLSGSTQSGLLTALRYLRLITKEGVPTENLRSFVTGEESARPGILLECVESCYPFLARKELELKAATPAMLHEALRELGVSGGTLEKTTAFFLAICGAAGVELSGHITKGRHATNGAPIKRSRNKRTAAIKASKEEVLPTPQPPPPPQVVIQEVPKPLEYQLIDLMGDPDIEDAVKASIWSLVQYLAARKKRVSVTETNDPH